MSQIHTVVFKAIHPSIQKLLSRNEIQDGCCDGHIEKAATLIFKTNHPLDGQNTLLISEQSIQAFKS
jgi:hypothetical protein